ncbi:MAG TPA: XRE family transcriptional regulator [Deltaproteobacteria bacterium]|nr:XRE family transcriptional regulator [Deltaproteobacteria bacterium]
MSGSVLVKSLRELRKAKGLTMEQLASISGVSLKTISLYEHTPPRRPGRKVISKLSDAFEMSPEELLEILSSRKGGSSDYESGSDEQESILIEEIHVSRLLSLIDREISELRHLMVECASLSEGNPALARNCDYISADIDLLMSLRERFQ